MDHYVGTYRGEAEPIIELYIDATIEIAISPPELPVMIEVSHFKKPQSHFEVRVLNQTKENMMVSREEKVTHIQTAQSWDAWKGIEFEDDPTPPNTVGLQLDTFAKTAEYYDTQQRSVTSTACAKVALGNNVITCVMQ